MPGIYAGLELGVGAANPAKKQLPVMAALHLLNREFDARLEVSDEPRHIVGSQNRAIHAALPWAPSIHDVLPSTAASGAGFGLLGARKWSEQYQLLVPVVLVLIDPNWTQPAAQHSP
jgi:hypothetical protein